MVLSTTSLTISSSSGSAAFVAENYSDTTRWRPNMEFQEIRYEVDDRVLTITLNRPDRLNAFTPTMQVELIEAIDQADADDGVRAVVVTGAGRGFCAGADLP